MKDNENQIDDQLSDVMHLLQHALQIPTHCPAASLVAEVEALGLTLLELAERADEVNGIHDCSLRSLALPVLRGLDIGEGVRVTEVDAWDDGPFADAADAVVEAICVVGLGMVAQDREAALAQFRLLAHSINATSGGATPDLRHRLTQALDLALAVPARRWWQFWRPF